jgi:hypothetical protein
MAVLAELSSEEETMTAHRPHPRTELPQMLGEHKAIVAALHHLVDAAKRENQMEYARFAEKLLLHAETEEEVFYPTAILLGEYLKLQLDM